MVRVLFLGGLGRSGTTLLERILGRLPGACALGEVVHLWQRDLRDDERCGCGVRFSACPFWRGVGARAFGGWHRVDLDRVLRLRQTVERTRHIPRLAAPRLRPARHALVTEYARYYRQIYLGAAETTGASVVIDSSKHSALAYCLRWAYDLDFRVVQLVRDPRGVAYSWTKRVARPESNHRAEMTRYSVGRAALLWTTHNAAFDLLGHRGVAVRRWRYEDFVANPRQITRDIAEFAGLAVTDAALSFLTDAVAGQATFADLTSGHSAAGNPMRFATGRVLLRRDDDWRVALPPRQRRLVDALAAPLLNAYGYPLSGGRRP